MLKKEVVDTVISSNKNGILILGSAVTNPKTTMFYVKVVRPVSDKELLMYNDTIKVLEIENDEFTDKNKGKLDKGEIKKMAHKIEKAKEDGFDFYGQDKSSFKLAENFMKAEIVYTSVSEKILDKKTLDSFIKDASFLNKELMEKINHILEQNNELHTSSSIKRKM